MAKNSKTESSETEDSKKHTREEGRPADEQAISDEAEREDEEEDEEEQDEWDDEPRQEAARQPAKSRRFRLRNWLLLGGAVAVVVFFVLNTESGPDVDPGDVLDANITLVTADRNDLDCLAAEGVDAYKCGFATEKTPRAVEERLKLRPFLTLDRQLYLVPGLFLEPAIEARYKAEPPDKPRTQLKRFTAKCKVKIVGELDNVRLRWSPGGQWEPRADDVRVATVSGCGIDG